MRALERKTSNSRSTLSTGSFRFFMLIAGPLFILYMATASFTAPHSVDTLTNALTAHEIGTHGDVYLEEHAVLASPKWQGYAAWIVKAGDSAASKYPPGAPLLAVPIYSIWPDTQTSHEFVAADGETIELWLPPLVPAALASAAAVAIAAGVFGLAIRGFAEDRLAIVGAYVGGLATGAWTVASDELWQHGPAMMWILLGTLLSATYQTWSGLAFGAAVLTRPHTAVVAACNGLWQSWQDRLWRPAMKIAIGTAVGVAALIIYNGTVFGALSISGGYGEGFTERALSLNLIDYLGNIALALFHPSKGLFVYSPFLLMLVPGLRSAWRVAPAWVRGSAMGGLVFFLLQLKANRYSGGGGFFGYRYPLEALAAWAPLLFLSYTEWIRKHKHESVRRVFRYAVIVSVEITALGALYLSSLHQAIVG